MKRAFAIVVLTRLLWPVAALNASGIDISLTVTNREAVARTAEPITAGVPFARGLVRDAGQLRLLKQGAEIPAQFLVTARWPDGSVRWVLADFQTDLSASGSTPITLQTGTAPSPVAGISVSEDPSTLAVNTQASTFTFAKSDLAIRGSRFVVQSDGILYMAVPGSWFIEQRGPMKVVVRVEGVWRNSRAPLVNDLNRFRARLVFFRGRNDVRVSFTFRNNNSYGWGTNGGGQPRQPDVVLTGASVGSTTLLPVGGSYYIGSGVEKTWEIVSPPSGGPVLVVTRYAADGVLVPGDAPPRPIAAASSAYYASTLAWGRIGLPVTGLAADRQADFDRFERIQRSMVENSMVENPPGLVGKTIWGQLSVDLTNWHDYGDLRWAGNGCGTLSSNHYDWTYGMYLQFMRTGRLAFADAAGVFARHGIDFDIYHTGADGSAYNYQQDWEDRPSHDNPGNCFGGGRPSHTWSQGYGLHWLLTGDRRGRDAFDEIREGVRQYVYESFNGQGYISTPEIRVQGWLVENLVNLWRIEPGAVLGTSRYGPKSITAAIQDVLKNVFDRERAAGQQGFVIDPSDPDGHLRQPLMHAYFVEPAIKAYDEVFAGRDAAYASSLLGLVQRMTKWLISVTYGGDTNARGAYRPRQIPYWVDTRLAQQKDGQLPYLLMVANAAGFLFTNTGDTTWRDYARGAFQDYVRHVCAIVPDSYGDPRLRTPASYNSNFFPGTESKIHGWSSRYGQYFLASESGVSPPAKSMTSSPASKAVAAGARTIHPLPVPVS